jgi:hypothetical protein
MLLRNRRRRALIALLAAFLTAAAPLLSRAHLAPPGEAEVCTDRGLVRVPTGDGQHRDGSHLAALAHCAACVSTGGDQALANDGPRALVRDRRAGRFVAGAERADLGDPVRAPRSRGPPRSRSRPR